MERLQHIRVQATHADVLIAMTLWSVDVSSRSLVSVAATSRKLQTTTTS